MPSRLAFVFLGFAAAACQHVDDIELGRAGPQMPAATDEHQRINVDAVPGVAPVRVTALADPRFPLPRERTSQREDRPPPEPPISRARRWYLELTGADRALAREICRETQRNPCFGILPRPGSPMKTLMAQLFPASATGDADRSIVHDYCREKNPEVVCNTPLVVSFDGEPVVFEASDVTFAFQPGAPVTTDWPSAATPWIALDLDGDGAIASGAELFGDATKLPSGATATTGFEALAALDANRDGVIDAKDPAFARLVLWADRDGNRESSAAELRPLAEVVIEIPLAHELVPRCARGNCEGERGAVRWRDAGGHARTGAVIDVYLRGR